MSTSTEVIWEGGPSQVENFGAYFWLTILTVLTVGIGLIITGPIMLYKYLSTKYKNYELTKERLIKNSGILSKQREQLELYRVRDYQVEKPFFLRMFSLGNLTLTSSDKNQPEITINAIEEPEELSDQIRHLVEENREKKGVSEIDME